MSKRLHGFARGIKHFVENPITNLVKGIGLLFFGFSDASHTFQDRATQQHVRMGHGLILIGLFNILAALPPLIESLESGLKFLDDRESKNRAGDGEAGS